jgi:hypothetical protein
MSVRANQVDVAAHRFVRSTRIALAEILVEFTVTNTYDIRAPFASNCAELVTVGSPVWGHAKLPSNR